MPIDQQQLVATHRQHPTGRDLLAEHPFADQLFPGFTGFPIHAPHHLAGGDVGHLAGPAGRDGELQRIARFIAGVETLHHPQPGLPFGIGHLGKQGDLIGLPPIEHGLRARREGIAKGVQQRLEKQLPLQPQPFSWIA